MRSFLILFFLSTILFSKETIEVFTKHIESTKDFFRATGDVVLLYDGALIKAEEATYDKNSSMLRFFGRVEMLREGENRLYSNSLDINTSSKNVEFKKLLLTTRDDLWIEAKSAKKEKENYKILESRLSSCNNANPDWTIEFAEAQYYKTKNYITLKDAKVTFFDTPILYLPYLAFSTVNTRTTGILIPSFKLLEKEGMVYQQPLFYALRSNLDIEAIPQLRTKRGYGGYLTTRFVDSNNSKGSFRLGYFKNFKSYARENNINKEHYGAEFLYQSTNFLPNSTLFENYEQGLYLNATYLSDLEYLNLQKESAKALISSNLVESRFNAFLYNETDYLALYAKYNIDVSKESNLDTIQELPTLHYHRFMSYLLSSDNLFYTFDAKVHNYTRVKGSRAYQTELDLPITYYHSFFNDLIDFSLTENLYLTNVSFSNLEKEQDNYKFYRNYHTVEISSDLSKAYGSNVHTLHPSIVYTRPSFEDEKPRKYKNLTQEQKELFVTQTTLENLSIGLSQYLYNNDSDLTLFHRLAVTDYADSSLPQGDLNNEFSYHGNNINLYSNLFYSLDKNRLHSLTTSVAYTKNDYDIILTHFYNNDILLNQDTTSFIHASLQHNYNKHNQWYVKSDFDLENSFTHQWEVGWTHKQKCWSATVNFGQEQVPNVGSSFKNTTLFFELSLNPLGSISKNIENDFSGQGNR